MLEGISSKLFVEWMAFNAIEPFGTEAGFLGHAITASTVANANRAKNQKAYKPNDFMPEFDKRPQTVDQMLQIAQALTIAHGGEDKRNLSDG